MNVQVGNIIKSYDFHFKTDCYMIGRVTKIEGEYLCCDTIKVVFGGEMDPIQNMRPEFRTPMMGCMMDDEEFARVVVLD